MSSTFVGGRYRKHDGDRYLTGQVRYTADLVLPGMVHVALVRSPYAHARIAEVDASAAEAHATVVAVLTGAQAAQVSDPIPFLLDPAGLGGVNADVRCLAVDTVVYAGQPVVAVAAGTPADAAAAASLVRVRYEVLPAVLDAEAALADDAPIVHEGWASNVMLAGSFGPDDFASVAAEG